MSNPTYDFTTTLTLQGDKISKWTEQFVALSRNRRHIVYFDNEDDYKRHIQTNHASQRGIITLQNADVYDASIYLKAKLPAAVLAKAVGATANGNNDEKDDAGFWRDTFVECGVRIKSSDRLALVSYRGVSAHVPKHVYSMHGWLQKKGAINPAFQTRFMRVTENAAGKKVLAYYKEITDTEPKGVILLPGATVRASEDAAGVAAHAFDMTIPDGSRIFYFRAPSLEEKLRWLDVLRAGAAKASSSQYFWPLLEGDHYVQCGVTPTATADQIQASYRERAEALNPVLNPSLEAKQKLLQLESAYWVLRDANRRTQYDNNLRRAAIRRAEKESKSHGKSPSSSPTASFASSPSVSPVAAAVTVDSPQAYASSPPPAVVVEPKSSMFSSSSPSSSPPPPSSTARKEQAAATPVVVAVTPPAAAAAVPAEKKVIGPQQPSSPSPTPTVVVTPTGLVATSTTPATATVVTMAPIVATPAVVVAAVATPAATTAPPPSYTSATAAPPPSYTAATTPTPAVVAVTPTPAPAQTPAPAAAEDAPVGFKQRPKKNKGGAAEPSPTTPTPTPAAVTPASPAVARVAVAAIPVTPTPATTAAAIPVTPVAVNTNGTPSASPAASPAAGVTTSFNFSSPSANGTGSAQGTPSHSRTPSAIPTTPMGASSPSSPATPATPATGTPAAAGGHSRTPSAVPIGSNLDPSLSTVPFVPSVPLGEGLEAVDRGIMLYKLPKWGGADQHLFKVKPYPTAISRGMAITWESKKKASDGGLFELMDVNGMPLVRLYEGQREGRWKSEKKWKKQFNGDKANWSLSLIGAKRSLDLVANNQQDFARLITVLRNLQTVGKAAPGTVPSPPQ